jgi:hypothetical protein
LAFKSVISLPSNSVCNDGVAISEKAADQIEFHGPEGNRVVVSGHAWN